MSTYWGKGICDRCDVADLPLHRVPAPETRDGVLLLCLSCRVARGEVVDGRKDFDLSDVKEKTP